jgi:hypothetical protein
MMSELGFIELLGFGRIDFQGFVGFNFINP